MEDGLFNLCDGILKLGKDKDSIYGVYMGSYYNSIVALMIEANKEYKKSENLVATALTNLIGFDQKIKDIIQESLDDESFDDGGWTWAMISPSREDRSGAYLKGITLDLLGSETEEVHQAVVDYMLNNKDSMQQVAKHLVETQYTGLLLTIIQSSYSWRDLNDRLLRLHTVTLETVRNYYTDHIIGYREAIKSKRGRVIKDLE